MTTPLRPDEAFPDPSRTSESADGPSDDEHRTMALVAWGLLLGGVVAFLPGLVAAMVAYAKRGDAPPLWRGHYDRVIRMFWIWLILVIIGTPLILVLIGYPILAVAAIWTAVASRPLSFRVWSSNRSAKTRKPFPVNR